MAFLTSHSAKARVLSSCSTSRDSFKRAMIRRRRFWRPSAGSAFSGIVSRLLQAFDVTRDELRNDLAVLALELQQEGIIRIQ